MNESCILKAGFILQKNASKYYSRIKELSKELKNGVLNFSAIDFLLVSISMIAIKSDSGLL
jgi:hypothetical protein